MSRNVGLILVFSIKFLFRKWVIKLLWHWIWCSCTGLGDLVTWQSEQACCVSVCQCTSIRPEGLSSASPFGPLRCQIEVIDGTGRHWRPPPILNQWIQHSWRDCPVLGKKQMMNMCQDVCVCVCVIYSGHLRCNKPCVVL